MPSLDLEIQGNYLLGPFPHMFAKGKTKEQVDGKKCRGSKSLSALQVTGGRPNAPPIGIRPIGIHSHSSEDTSALWPREARDALDFL